MKAHIPKFILVLSALLMSLQLACTPLVVVDYTSLNDNEYSRRNVPADSYNGPVEALLNNKYLLIGYIDFKQNIRKCFKDYQCNDITSLVPAHSDLSKEAAERGGDFISLLDENIILEKISKNYCSQYITYSYIVEGKTHYASRCTIYQHVDGYQEIRQRRALIWRKEKQYADASANHKAIEKAMSILAQVYDDTDSKSQLNKTADQTERINVELASLINSPVEKKLAKIGNDSGSTEVLYQEDMAKLNMFMQNPVDKGWRDKKGRNLLMVALLAQKHEMADALVNAGLIEGNDNQGNSVLKYAVQFGKVGIVSKLVEKSGGLGLEQTSVTSLLNHAMSNPDVRVLDLLLKKGLNAEEIGHNGMTLLMYAAQLGRVDAVKLLHEFYGFRVNARMNNRATLFMIAAKEGKQKVIEYLAETEANIYAQDEYGNNALMFAVQSGDLSTVKVLIKLGMNMNQENGAGFIPVHLAIAKKDWLGVEYLLMHTNNITSMKVKMSDLMAEFIREDRITLLDKLLSRFKDRVTKFDLQKMIFLSAMNNKSGFIRYLFKEEADIDAVNDDGITPLMIAAEMGNVEAVNTLLDLKANPELLSKADLTALMYATIGGHVEVVRIMRKAGVKS